MMGYTYGNYGFIRHEKMENPPLFLNDLGLEYRTDTSYSFDNKNRHSYGGYLFQYTLSGCGVYEDAAGIHLLPEGHAFFSKIPEDSRYYLPREKEGAHWELFYLHFYGPAADSFFQTIRSLAGPVIALPGDHPAVRLFFRLYESCQSENGLALYEGAELLYRFLTQVLRTLESPSAEGSALILQACAYLKKHAATASGISEAANACQVSQEHLTRCFKKETGQTPLQYLTRLRLENALFYLLNTEDSINEIARCCGFSNGNYFAKVFRKYLKCSPEEYRKRNRC